MNLAEKIKNIFLYLGLDKATYKKLEHRIQEENRKILTLMSFVVGIIMTGMAVLNSFSSFLHTSTFFYIAGAITEATIFILCVTAAKKNTKMMPVLVEMNLVIVYALCVGIATFGSTESEPTVTLFVVMIFMPLIFIGRPITFTITNVIATVAFIILDSFKLPDVYSRDLTNVIVYLLLGTALSTWLIHTRADSKKLLYELEETRTELSDNYSALQNALDYAEYASKAKTTFLNNMSHDIRTPMNAIVGFTALAAAHIDNKEQVQDYLQKITSSSQHLLSLINDVLDMSRIESGKMKIEEKPVHLPDVLHDLRNIIQVSITNKQLNLFIDTVDVINEDVVCDPLRLNQVLLNLTSNAIKFTQSGGFVSIKLTQKPSQNPGYALYEFRVKDNGIGMSKEFAEHVFDSFAREENTTVSRIQGTGLGMSITKNIVDLMSGSIEVESEKDKGTEFIVTIPFKISGDTLVDFRIPALQGIRALVVDDESSCCVSVSDMLIRIGLRTDWTLSGHEAVLRTEVAKQQNDSYGVFIIDFLMPDMNGIETVRRIRRVIGNEAPIIVLTAYDWADIEKEAREAGVTAFCSKPLFMSELREVLSKPFNINVPKEDQPVQESVSFAGHRVLLVEDNELNREIASTLLSDYGLDVEEAEDGSVAVQKLKDAAAGYYELVLMDIQMPVMNGYEATKQIRALDDAGKSGIPIYAMTANAFEEDKRLALESGMNGHLAKPINLSSVISVLSDNLK